MNSNRFTGFAVALAWPQTYCKQPGSWYDPLMLLLGFNKNNYYKVGHAAVVLISNSGTVKYFDFGRYHAPFGCGRVRSDETDHDLELDFVPEFTDDKQKIKNFNDLLYELQKNEACHGEGTLFASYTPVNFEDSLTKAVSMEASSPIPYGPFRVGGSNCSRFVQSVILAGSPALLQILKLKLLAPLTPTPISNVNALSRKTAIAKLLQNISFFPVQKLNKHELLSTLPEPKRHHSIPLKAQWLAGEGAGSWFYLTTEGHNLNVTRYSQKGIIECVQKFNLQTIHSEFCNIDEFKITYPSNCKVLTIITPEKKISLFNGN
jgi:hypothetical protein